MTTEHGAPTREADAFWGLRLGIIMLPRPKCTLDRFELVLSLTPGV
jgi:hypothetical protein